MLGKYRCRCLLLFRSRVLFFSLNLSPFLCLAFRTQLLEKRSQLRILAFELSYQLVRLLPAPRFLPLSDRASSALPAGCKEILEPIEQNLRDLEGARMVASVCD